MKLLKITFFLSVSCFLCFFSCTTVDLYEKSLPVPGHAWYNSFRPTFEFIIKDTNSAYQPLLILRHNEKYHYRNIYINLYIQGPGQDTAQKFQLDLPLASKDGKWLATGMDDIYEHRISLLESPPNLKAGLYKFTVEQIMRENPLQNVYDVGIRVEKQ
ncbi:MAG TPA: gliding motility lipoprotein GldH [Chitinophagaceae bacterium]|nr:gliding motility lipoprotein GldH [Chitinophagaceae bacterium]